jgi:hypothetical protein
MSINGIHLEGVGKEKIDPLIAIFETCGSRLSTFNHRYRHTLNLYLISSLRTDWSQLSLSLALSSAENDIQLRSFQYYVSLTENHTEEDMKTLFSLLLSIWNKEALTASVSEFSWFVFCFSSLRFVCYILSLLI